MSQIFALVSTNGFVKKLALTSESLIKQNVLIFLTMIIVGSTFECCKQMQQSGFLVGTLGFHIFHKITLKTYLVPTFYKQRYGN